MSLFGRFTCLPISFISSHSLRLSTTYTYNISQIDGPYRNQDETIELALNLNLVPRKPGQALRGSCSLPHGTGKTVSVVVFTNDAELAKSLQEQGGDNKGAVVAGGDELISDLASGVVPLTLTGRWPRPT